MRKERDRARKWKELVLERSRAASMGGRRLITSNNRQNEKEQSFSSGPQSYSKKRKLKVFGKSSCEDDNDMAPTKRKKRKMKGIIPDTKNQTKPGGVNSLMCHQCQRRDKGRVVNCTVCSTRRFCISCITNWYPLLSEEEIAERCPVCRGYCNCKCCLRKKINTPPRKEIYTADKVKHAWHMVQYLYPWLREFHEQQNAEKRKEAGIKGVDASDLVIPKAKYTSEHIFCNICNGYIVDFHWSCRNCTCLLCLSCCQELLESDLPATEAVPLCVSDEWHPDCDSGLCEIPVLELKSVLGESFISKLYEEVSEIVANNPNFEKSEGDISKCCCSTKSDGKVNMFCPTARDVKEGHFGYFGWHWVKGEPVIVKNVLELTSGLSWEPMVMWRALRETKYNGQESKLSVLAIDCRAWADVEINIHKFFTGYQEGLSHKDGSPRLLRLKNCFEDGSFATRLPRHEEEFMAALPFPEYTDPLCGSLNLAAKLPTNKPSLELRPKINIAYGVRDELKDGNSVTKLHYDSYDVVNILMHNKEVHLTVKQHNAVLRKHKGKRDKVRKMAMSDDYGGCLWDIWRREDVPKLRDYLTKHARDFTNCYNPPLYLVDDLIRSESVYLTTEHKRNLKDEYGIEAWTFEQKLGDAVCVPAGCPYQVRNLKSCINVRLGFVSPESFRVCIRLAEELRLQSRAKEDKLEVKKMAVYALEEATSCLRLEMLKTRKNEQKVEREGNKKRVDSSTISKSGPVIKPDNKNRATMNVPEPDKSHMVTVDDASDLIFYDLECYVTEPKFHDFDGDRVERLFKPNQIWAIYGEKDGMPRYYAFIEKMISLTPFEIRLAFLSSRTDSEFGEIDWVSMGLEKACGEFRLCRYKTNTNLSMFSHRVKWEKGRNGAIKIFPRKGDVWALYRNWSPDWDKNTRDETVYKYDVVEIVEEYDEKKKGIRVAPLVKVNGFNAVFRKDLDPARVKRFPRKEMSRFSFQVPSYRLTHGDAGTKGDENLTGCVELDPSATPSEWLEVTALF